MALKDFDVTQLATDAQAIAGVDGTASEPFLLASVTYYGVFASTDLGLPMDTVGFKDEREIRLSIPRASLTAGITFNAFLRRVFDSTTWQVVRGQSDEGWHDYTLRRQFLV
jgi:hypothetical protein